MEQKKRDDFGKFIKGFSHPRKRIEINLDLLKKEYLSGKSSYDLEKEFNIKQKTIINRLKEMKILRTKKESIKLSKEKISKTMKERGIRPKKINKIPWNKGKIGLQVAWNKDKKTGQKNWKNRTFSEEVIKKIKEARAKQIFPLKDSSIEVKVQNFLKQLDIEYFTHQYIKIEHGYQCDILIPSINLVIECDGDYWHKYPIGRDIDRIRTKELKEKGFKVLRLWEHNIRKITLEKFERKLLC